MSYMLDRDWLAATKRSRQLGVHVVSSLVGGGVGARVFGFVGGTAGRAVGIGGMSAGLSDVTGQTMEWAAGWRTHFSGWQTLSSVGLGMATGYGVFKYQAWQMGLGRQAGDIAVRGGVPRPPRGHTSPTGQLRPIGQTPAQELALQAEIDAANAREVQWRWLGFRVLQVRVNQPQVSRLSFPQLPAGEVALAGRNRPDLYILERRFWLPVETSSEFDRGMQNALEHVRRVTANNPFGFYQGRLIGLQGEFAPPITRLPAGSWAPVAGVGSAAAVRSFPRPTLASEF